MNKRASIIHHLTILIVLLCLPSVLLLAQEIRTSAPEEVLEGEMFQIRYSIISNEPVQEMPKLVDTRDYEMVREPQTRHSQPSFFSRDNYYTLQLVYTFKPTKTGELKIPRIEMTIDGYKLSSEKRNILVHKLPPKEDITCFVKVYTTKKQVNMGDTLTITYKLYSTKEVSAVVDIQIPRLNDFYYQDISPRREQYTVEHIDGKDYKVYVVRQYLIQARSLGTKKQAVGNMEVEYTYPTGRKRSDAWGRTYDEQFKGTKTCVIEPISILVHDMISI